MCVCLTRGVVCLNPLIFDETGLISWGNVFLNFAHNNMLLLLLLL